MLFLVRARERAGGEMVLGKAAHRVAKHFLLFAQFEIHGGLSSKLSFGRAQSARMPVAFTTWAKRAICALI